MPACQQRSHDEDDDDEEDEWSVLVAIVVGGETPPSTLGGCIQGTQTPPDMKVDVASLRPFRDGCCCSSSSAVAAAYASPIRLALCVSDSMTCVDTFANTSQSDGG